MGSAAQLMADGLAPYPIPDLRDISLVELARLAGDGDDAIHGVVERMVDGLESPSVIPAMIFNSAI